MGEKGRKFIETQYTLEQCGSLVEKVYSQYTDKIIATGRPQ